MDKYELKVTIGEIDSLIGRRRLGEAAQIADTVDWRRVKNVRTLCRVSDVYKINKRYDDSKRILELAYVKNPYGRQIIFSLCELELKLGNYVRALQLYNEYINVAPRDPARYVLQYKLYKEQDVSVNERIAVLEEMARHDLRDRWAFELAKLYLEAGERSLCASQCDEIVAFFGDGKYVRKALELKASFSELTVKQKALYRKMTGQDDEEQEEAADSSARMPEEERSPAEETGPSDAEGGPSDAEGGPSGAKAGSSDAEGGAAKKEGGRQEAETAAAVTEAGPSKTEDVRPVNETAVSVAEAGTAKKEGGQPANETPVSDAEAGASKKEGGQPAEETAAPDDKAGPSEKETAAPVKEPAAGKKDEELIPVLNREPAMTEIPWEYEDFEVRTRELKKKRTVKKQAERSGRSLKSAEPQVVTEAAPPPKDHSVFEDHTFEIGAEEESMFSPENMQKTIAKGLRSLDNYDPFLMQETDGQYAMVMQEEKKPDKQITGQLDLEEIMSEWEKVKRDFYETNGIEDDEPQEPEGIMPVIPVNGGGNGAKSGHGSGSGGSSGNTKSWDPGEVHKALEIIDDDAGAAGYDTSLFVTEGGGDFPSEFKVEQMTLSTRGRAGGAEGHFYLHSEDSIRQLTDALGRTFLEGGKGNVVITGDEGSGTLSLARELVRRYRKINPNFVGQIAKSEGIYITRENMLRVIPRMPFGALIIERASRMSEEGAAALCEMITVPERSILIIMIDRRGVMDAFLNDHPKVREMFPARVDIAALSVDTLLGYAREYAAKQQCEIDEYGISALQSRILSMQTVEHNVTLEDIRDIVDEAVYYASRKTISSLVDSFSRRKGGAQNRIIIRDKDFLHY